MLAAGGESSPSASQGEGRGEGQRYPWGTLKDEKQITRYANTRESGINRTTPVWVYPGGASPHGVLDMSGNVWEWQANMYSKDREYPAVRGGSWGLDQDDARVGLRLRSGPSVRYGDRGFRVVFAPHLPVL